MTLIDWMMEHPYLAAALIVYVGAVLVAAKVEITIKTGSRKENGEKEL